MPNYDEETGIRYGVISPHSISSYALDDIYQDGEDPHYEFARDEILDDLKLFCEEHNIRYEDLRNPSEFADLYTENYENPDGAMDYSDSDYNLHVSGDNFGIFVMKSPYYTYCRGCSPCAPGAGDLDNPVERDPDYPDADKTICLGPEWFDNERKIPYRVFKISDDSEVIV